MPEGDYDKAFGLINPEAPVWYTWAAASDEQGKPYVMLLIETMNTSERFFWPLDMAEHFMVTIAQLIQTMKRQETGGLQVVQEIPHRLRSPDGN